MTSAALCLCAVRLAMACSTFVASGEAMAGTPFWDGEHRVMEPTRQVALTNSSAIVAGARALFRTLRLLCSGQLSLHGARVAAEMTVGARYGFCGFGRIV